MAFNGLQVRPQSGIFQALESFPAPARSPPGRGYFFCHVSAPLNRSDRLPPQVVFNRLGAVSDASADADIIKLLRPTAAPGRQRLLLDTKHCCDFGRRQQLRQVAVAGLPLAPSLGSFRTLPLASVVVKFRVFHLFTSLQKILDSSLSRLRGKIGAKTSVINKKLCQNR